MTEKRFEPIADSGTADTNKMFMLVPLSNKTLRRIFEHDMNHKIAITPTGDETFPSRVTFYERDMDLVYEFVSDVYDRRVLNEYQFTLLSFALPLALPQLEKTFGRNSHLRPHALWLIDALRSSWTSHAHAAYGMMLKAVRLSRDIHQQESVTKLVAKAQAEADIIHNRLARAIVITHVMSPETLVGQPAKTLPIIEVDEETLRAYGQPYAARVATMIAKQEIMTSFATAQARKALTRYIRNGKASE